MELTNAGLWVVLVLFLNPQTLLAWLTLVCWLILASLLLAALVYDAKWMQLPDQFLVPALALSGALALLSWPATGSLQELAARVGAAILFAGVFWIVWRFSGGAWLGDGDIWLAGIMALALTGVQLVSAIFIGFNLGAIVALGLILAGRKSRKSTIAFGPFLIIGLFAGLFVGERLLNWYLGIFV